MPYYDNNTSWYPFYHFIQFAVMKSSSQTPPTSVASTTAPTELPTWKPVDIGQNGTKWKSRVLTTSILARAALPLVCSENIVFSLLFLYFYVILAATPCRRGVTIASRLRLCTFEKNGLVLFFKPTSAFRVCAHSVQLERITRAFGAPNNSSPV